MRPNGKHLDRYRKRHPTMGGSPAGALYGYFRIKREGATLEVISSGESHGGPMGEWEHVSVSLRAGHSLPTWEQMVAIKALFWRPDETVVQFHPAESEYVDVAEVLHLWKPPYHLDLPPRGTLA